MAREINVSRSARSILRRVPTHLRGRLYAAIQGLADDPTPKVATELTGSPGVWRIRVGSWRVVYTFNADEVRIQAIASRGDIYKRS